MTSEEVYKVNRLIYLSLAYSSGTKKIVAANLDEAGELIQKFRADKSFQDLVFDGLNAMELQLLDIDDLGLRLSAKRAETFFAANLTDYGKMMARNEMKTAEILCVHCAVAAAFFPTESDLDAPVEDLGAVILEDVMDILRRFSKMENSSDFEDDDLLHPEVRTAIQRFRDLPEENPDIKKGIMGNSWVELISRVLDHMSASGYILEFEEGAGEKEYRPTPAYQAALKNASAFAFHSFLEILSKENEYVSEAGGENV